MASQGHLSSRILESLQKRWSRPTSCRCITLQRHAVPYGTLVFALKI